MYKANKGCCCCCLQGVGVFNFYDQAECFGCERQKASDQGFSGLRQRRSRTFCGVS